jgi:hypothetical protein
MLKGKNSAPVGRKVAFVGGPEAGNVRTVPEDVAVLSSGDWEYAITGLSFVGDSRKLWFAFDRYRSPADLILELWDEYCPAAMIKRDATPSSIRLKQQRRGG